LIHHVAGSGALFLVRRLLEAASRNLPVMALLIIPVLIGIPHLYEWSQYNWSDPAVREAHHHLYMKSTWLDTGFFIGRTVFYFALWLLTAYLLNTWSKRQHEGDVRATHKLSMWGAVGIIVYVLSMTFAAFDWIMSLTPLWYSSLYGAIFVVGQGLSTLCVMQVLLTFLTNGTSLTSRVPARYFRDLGNLTLAFTLLWAYTNYSQWGIIWSGNIAEEAEWYTMRTQGDPTKGFLWLYIGTFLIVAHFVLPFLSLLSSSLKVKIENLSKLGLFLILMRFIDLHWYIAPTFSHFYATFSLADLGAPFMLGGLWLALWVMQMKKSVTLLPVTDPRFVKFRGEYSLPEANGAAREVVQHG
jgi:hypothetical protein